MENEPWRVSTLLLQVGGEETKRDNNRAERREERGIE